MIPRARPAIGSSEAAAAARVVRSGNVSQGKEVAAFERETARFLGVGGGAAVSSGTAALTLALLALGAGPDKEVILPAFASPALFHAVRLTGAAPVLADIHWHDMNISAAQARRKMTHWTSAAVAVHGFGAPSEMEALLKLGVPVVEDLSQALGAEDYDRRKLGGFGRAAVLSFSAGKLMTTGEGGMVVSDDRRLLDAVRDLREYEGKPADKIRMNAKMTDIQAAVGRVQLKRLPSFLEARRKWAERYREALKGLPFEVPLPLFGRVYHGFVVKTPRPVTEGLLASFERRGVDVRRPLERPLHWDLPGSGAFPVTERAWRRSLSLPLFPSLTETEFRKVISVLKESL